MANRTEVEAYNACATAYATFFPKQENGNTVPTPTSELTASQTTCSQIASSNVELLEHQAPAINCNNYANSLFQSCTQSETYQEALAYNQCLEQKKGTNQHPECNSVVNSTFSSLQISEADIITKCNASVNKQVKNVAVVKCEQSINGESVFVFTDNSTQPNFTPVGEKYPYHVAVDYNACFVSELNAIKGSLRSEHTHCNSGFNTNAKWRTFRTDQKDIYQLKRVNNLCRNNARLGASQAQTFCETNTDGTPKFANRLNNP